MITRIIKLVSVNVVLHSGRLIGCMCSKRAGPRGVGGMVRNVVLVGKRPPCYNRPNS